MKIKSQFIVMFFGLTIILSACGGPKPTCAPAALVAPNLTSPNMWQVVGSLTPTLSWTYPDNSCDPEGYRIDLSTGPLFADDLSGGTGNPSTSWGPGSPLQPGKEYKWGVQAMVGTTTGPYAGSRYFFTGPNCDVADLVAPTLLEPSDGAVITELSPTLKWDSMMDCLPEGYGVHLSTDPAFADTSLNGGTGNPSTRWGPGTNLVDCQTYYWRTFPGIGTDFGPMSSTFSFSIDVNGTCAASSILSGIVWHDLCAIPELGPVPDPPPTGCVDLGGGSYGANGIFEPGEPGIPGVEVALEAGPCPPLGAIQSAITDANGNFQFVIPPLSAGTYCLSIDPLTPPSVNVLIPGGFTNPASGQIEITLAEGEDLSDLNFGWDYQFLPAYEEPTPTPTLVLPEIPFGLTLKEILCWIGPGPLYEVVSSIPPNTRVEILGTGEGGGWVILNNPRYNVPCWADEDDVDTDDLNLIEFPIFEIPPLPTETPPADTSPPSINRVGASADPVYYPKGCGPNTLTIQALISDPSGVASAYVRYRYMGDDGYVGGWHTAAMSLVGGLYKATINVGSEAAAELSGDGHIDYQVFAEDIFGNSTSEPSGYVLGVQVFKCLPIVK